jgi:2-phospho-L-lactate/phosphoenolpyruvate guanylyltransferase
MIVALIPLKRLDLAKSRLQPFLSTDERRTLTRRMLQRVVKALRGCDAVDRVALVSPEHQVAVELGLDWVPDGATLNEALQGGIAWAVHAAAESALIIPADLAAVGADDIAALIAAQRSRPEIVIAPTRDGGTGALLVSPPDAVHPAFGPGSFARHVAAARTQGIAVRTVRRPGFARDVDRPEDLVSAMGARQLGRTGTVEVGE